MSAVPSPHPSSTGRRRVVAGLGWTCALLAAVTTAVARVAAPASPAADVARALAGQPRTVEGRVSGGAAYQPLAVPPRSAVAPTPHWRLLAAAARARELCDLAPTAANLQTFGVAALHASSFDDAVQALEDAAVAEPSSAAVQADLAAAYLARGAAPGRAVDLPRALEAADRARRLNPRLPDAAFNYAVALEHLRLRREAARAWEAYLIAFGDEPGWVDEARRRREALDVATSLVPTSPAGQADARLRDWADLVLRDPTRAAAPDLAAAGAFHAAIGEAAQRASGEARRLLAENVRELLDAEAALAEPDYGRADVLAAGVLARVPDPDSALRLWAVRLRLTTGFNTGLGVDLARITADLAAAAARLGFTGLASDAELRLGALDFVGGRYERAYAHYAEALRLRESLGNVRGAASARMAAADALRMLGRDPEAWERYVANLRAGTLGDGNLESVRLTGPAQASLTAWPAVARTFAREAAHHAASIGHMGFLANARQLEARALWRLGDAEAAADALARAREALDQHDDVAIRERYLAEFALAESELLSTRAPAAAAPAIADTERRLRTNVGQRLVALSVLEAQVQRRLGNTEAARAALRKGVALVDTQQRAINQADFLPSFVDASWDVFSEFVDLEAAAGRNAEALGWLDRGFDIRRRWSGDTRGASLTEVSRGGPVVTWLSRPDGLWIWVVTDGAVESRHVAVTSETLARQAARLSYVLTLESAPDAVDDAVRAIARDVWWPIVGALVRGGEAPRRVALVPDPLLQRVPFALLPWSRVDDAPVVERAATVLCPSLSACGAGEAAVPPGARVSALHAGQGGAGLAVLPAARDEAERIGRRYAGADVTTATAAAFAAALAGADVVHFSGHAVPDERYPGRSELLLASDGGDGVRVPLAQLFGPAVRAGLVVLSACRTSRAEARRGEGGIGVAGEFLRAGVRQVLATQWDVRDDVAGEVMDLVHESLASGAKPWDAVRHAQRIVRRGGARPARDWAGYVAYTAVSLR